MNAEVVRNITFNLKLPGELQRICDNLACQDFGLVRVVPFTEYEAVAVFEKVSSGGEGEK